MSALDRFETKFLPEPMSGCWLWEASLRPNGYGRFGMGGAGNTEYAHRASWRLYRGEIPTGMCVLHRCDNPACVNPDHLFLGTQGDNSQDKWAKGRGVKGEKASWSKLTEEDVRAIRADKRSLAQVAADFDISFQNVGLIKQRKTWAHVAAA